MTRGRPAAAQSGQAAAAQGGADGAPQKWPVWAIRELPKTHAATRVAGRVGHDGEGRCSRINLQAQAIWGGFYTPR